MSERTTGTERFTARERGALYWAAWWMQQQNENRQLGDTLRQTYMVIRKMVGQIPANFDPLDPIPDHRIVSVADLTRLAEMSRWCEYGDDDWKLLARIKAVLDE